MALDPDQKPDVIGSACGGACGFLAALAWLASLLAAFGGICVDADGLGGRLSAMTSLQAAQYLALVAIGLGLAGGRFQRAARWRAQDERAAGPAPTPGQSPAPSRGPAGSPGVGPVLTIHDPLAPGGPQRQRAPRR